MMDPAVRHRPLTALPAWIVLLERNCERSKLAAHEALGLHAADHDPSRDNQSCQPEWENARRCFARILDRFGLLAPKLEDFVPLLIRESIQVWPCLNDLRAG